MRMRLERPFDGKNHNYVYRAQGVWFSIKGCSCHGFFYFHNGHTVSAKKTGIIKDFETSGTESRDLY